MKKDFFIGLDAGGSSVRCLILDAETGNSSVIRRQCSFLPSADAPGLGYEIDTTFLSKCVLDCLKEAWQWISDRGGRLVGIGVCSMRNTTVILNEKLEILCAVPNQDARAVLECLSMSEEEKMLVHKRSGHYPSPIFTGPRLRWLVSNRPEIVGKARHVMSLSDWICLFLSGEIFADRSQAGETLLFDLESSVWSGELVELFGVDMGIMPELKDPCSPVGHIRSSLAKRAGLPSDTLIATAGADTQCALLGSGACEDGDICAVAGTTMPVQQVLDRLLIEPEGRLWSGLHVVPGVFVLESNGLAAGTALEWFSGILFPEHSEPHKALIREAGKAPPLARGVFSTVGANLFDAREIRIPVGNITLSQMVTEGKSKGRQTLSRAVLEGIAFSLRANIEQLVSFSGRNAKRVMLTGGMSRSELWCGMVSDVTGLEVFVPDVPDSSALGAALCAAVAAGMYPDAKSAAYRYSRKGKIIEPGENASKYDAAYGSWSRLLANRRSGEECVMEVMTSEMLAGAKAGVISGYEPNVLITAPMGKEGLESLGRIARCRYEPWLEKGLIYTDGRKLAEALSGFQVLITEVDIVDFEVFRGSPDLRAVISCRGNPVNVDVESATAYGVAVINTPGRNAGAVADLTLAFMLSLARKLIRAHLFMREEGAEEGDLKRLGEAYRSFRGSELWGKTVGIIGFGNVGREVARRASAFGADILFYDPYVDEYEGAFLNARKCSFEEVVSTSDFLTVHAPSGAETERMIDATVFRAMKREAFFINTARASLVDEEALVDALRNKEIAGAALDVFSIELPGSDNPLLNFDNVLTTPHIGGNTFETADHQGELAASELERLIRLEKPLHILNPEVLDSFSWTGQKPVPLDEVVRRLSMKKKPTITS